ncbi:MAG: hypothetical protein IJ545_07355 [Alphaproteobacteria bacterium]|nr:hypothetical protein [Alphaproteobacteria bacterium]
MKMIAKHIRVLPLIIFLSVLMLTIRVESVFEMVQKHSIPQLSLNELQAAETSTPETAALTTALQTSDMQKDAQASSDNHDDEKKNQFTQSEIQILQELAERREALDLRSQEIDKKAVQLKVSEQEIDKRLKQMQEYEQKLKQLIREYNEKEKAKIMSLVKVYASMKPKEAARIFETLDLEVAVALLKEMKPSNSSAILAQITPVRAKAITDKIIGNAF